MVLFKKDKIILNSTRYQYFNHTYYYADNKVSDNLHVRKTVDDFNELMDIIKYTKQHIHSNSCSQNNSLIDLLYYLRESKIDFDDEQKMTIKKELESLLPVSSQEALSIIECIALFKGNVHKKVFGI